MSIIITLLLLGIIVFIHEFGHFITAKIFHMPVLEFAVGIGPKVISKKIKTTVYSIRAIPFGGFVSIDGMESGSEVENGFNSQNPMKRLIVLSAGVIMNFLSAIIALFILISAVGMAPGNKTTVKIESILSSTHASQVLKKGDVIIGFNDKKISNWKEFQKEIHDLNAEGYDDEEVELKVLRDNQEVNLKTKLTLNEESSSYIMGVQVEPAKLTFLDKIVFSVTSFVEILKEMIKGLVFLVTGKVGVNNLSGPIGLTKVVGQAYSQGGGIVLLNLFAFLSLNIGIFNLLPFPALDGGRIIFVLLEVIGVKVNKKLEERFHIFGFILLMGLMVFVVFNDVKNF